MFKNILLPTDGSAASEKAIHAGVALAAQTGARVTGLYVKPEFRTFTYNTEMLEDTADQFARDSELRASKFLSVIEAAAETAGVSFDLASTTSAHPFEAIIDMARERGCDLVAMASHGHKGIKGLLMGSETQKVLLHSHIPVLVYR